MESYPLWKCRYTREDITRNNYLENKRCTAEYDENDENGNTQICELRLNQHPTAHDMDLQYQQQLFQLQKQQQPPQEKTILVKSYIGENVQDILITFTNLQRPLETIQNEVNRLNILKRGMFVDSFKLVTAMNALVTDFASIRDQSYLIFHIPKRIIPLSGNEWTDVQLNKLMIVFQDVDLQDFFINAALTNFEMSSRGVELVEKLTNLNDSLAQMYVPMQPDDPDDQHATAEDIRANPLLQNPICKALFAAKKYAKRESFIDDFVKHLLNVMGFNDGSLYAAPRMRINLYFGDTERMATADVTIIDLLSYARIGVITVKNCDEMTFVDDSTAQLVAEGIAMTQRNESMMGQKRTVEGESETVYGIRVMGSVFHFYALQISSAIHTAMMSQVAAVSQTTMYRYKSDTGLDFMVKTERDEIILMLSLLQQVATNTSTSSPLPYPTEK